MDVYVEIKRILSKLSGKRKLDGADFKKLEQMFSSSELDVPDELLESSFYRIHQSRDVLDEQSDIHPDFMSNPPRLLRILKTSIVPAFALGILFFIFTVTFNFNMPGHGTVEKITGEIKVQRDSEILHLEKGDSLYAGDILLTSPGSNVYINVNNAVILKLDEKSNLLMNGDLENNNIDLLLNKGAVLVSVNKLHKHSNVSIDTPGSRGVVRGTVFGVKIDNNNVSRFEVYDGKVQVMNRIDIDRSKYDLATLNSIDRYFDRNSKVVTRNEVCEIKHVFKIDKSLNPQNVTSLLKDIPAPSVIKGKSENLMLKDSINEFLVFASNIKSSKVDKQAGSADRKKNRDESKHIPPDWKTSIQSGFIVNVPYNNRVIIAEKNGRLLFSDLKNILWAKEFNNKIVIMPEIDQSSVYFTTTGGYLYSIDIETGNINWKTNLHDIINSKGMMTSDRNNIYITTSMGSLLRFTKKGRLVWQVNFYDYIESRPLIVNEKIYVSVWGGNLFCIDKRTGRKTCSLTLKSQVSSMASEDDKIFVAVNTGVVYCYDLITYKKIWAYDTESGIKANIVAHNSSIFLVTNRGDAFKISGAGGLLWKKNIGVTSIMNPRVYNNRLYIASKRTLFALNVHSGLTSWSVVMPQITSENLTITESGLHVIDDKKGYRVFKSN